MSDVNVYSNWLMLREPPVDWEPRFQSGSGAVLASEVPGYALVAGYVHKFVGRGAVLDAGCGEATLAEYLDLERLEYTGFDVSSTASVRARDGLRRGTVFNCSIEEYLPAPGKWFDAIVFKGSLPSIDDPLGSLDRYRSFLKSDGVIVVALFVNSNEKGNSSLLARFLEEACANGRYDLVERADAISVTHGLSWRVFVLKK